MSRHHIMTPGEWALLVFLSLVWGASFMFIEIGLRELSPFNIAAFRIVIAGLILFCYVLVRREPLPKSPRTWLALAVLSLFANVVPFSLIMWGQQYITSGLASILNATTPIFALTLAHLFTSDEPMTRNRLGGVLLGFTGVAVMMGPELLAGMTLHGWGQFAVLGAAFCYGCAGVLARNLRGIPSTVISAGSLMCASVIIIPVALFFDSSIRIPEQPSTWLALLWMSALGTALAYLIYYRLISTAGPTNTSLTTLLVPLNALLLGALVLGETLDWHAAAGMTLIFAGLLTVDGRVLRWLAQGRAAPGAG
jgi:drug/metabolite transporter (DMT)-like permease